MTRFDSTQIAPATPTVRRAFGYSIFMLLFILLSYCQDAHAAPLPRTAAWDPPTTRENGEPLTVDELDHYTLYELVDGAQVARGTFPGSAVTATLSLEQARCYTLVMTVTDTQGLESQPSGPVSACTYAPGKPLRFRLQP